MLFHPKQLYRYDFYRTSNFLIGISGHEAILFCDLMVIANKEDIAVKVAVRLIEMGKNPLTVGWEALELATDGLALVVD